jgi:hypothetical protein
MRAALALAGVGIAGGVLALGFLGPAALEEHRAERAYRLAVAVRSNADACEAADRLVAVYLEHGNESGLRKWAPIRDLACAGYPPSDA